MVVTTQLTRQHLSEMEQRQRAQLINSLGGFKSVSLIGSIDEAGQTNLAIFSSVFHIGANPPLLAFIVRPDSVDRHTLTNILATGDYTVNHINVDIYKNAHQTSARYDRNIAEFDAVGLEREFIDPMKAPFVKESHVKLGLEFRQRLDIGINGTIMIIGEIVHVSFPANCWCEDGYLDIEKAGTVTCTGLDSYHTTQRLERLSYAKPDRPLTSLSVPYLH